jgi:hypothetical protein
VLSAWESAAAQFPGEFESDFRFRFVTDEFRFVCRDFETALRSLTHLRVHALATESKAKIRIRACIAGGTRSLTDHRDPFAQDGTAFHLAREGLERLRRMRVPLTLVRFENNAGREELINGLLPLADRSYSRWTKRQAQKIVQGIRSPEWTEYEQFNETIILLAGHLRSAMSWLMATINRSRMTA